MRLLLLTFSLSLGLLACTKKSAENNKVSTAQQALTLKDVPAVLKIMQKQNKAQLDSVSNFYVQLSDGYQIYSVKDSTQKSFYINSRMTNQVTPGVERKIYKGNSFEIWNRGGFASLSATDIQAISPAFTFLGTAVVDSVNCYKLLVDKVALFKHPAGKMLFDDNNTEGNPKLTLYINPNNGLISRIVGKNENGTKVSITWRKWTKFKVMDFATLRSTTESGKAVTVTPEIEQQVASINEEMNTYLTQIDSGQMNDIPPDQLAKMRQGILQTLAENKVKLDNLRKGFSEDIIMLSNIRINKGYPTELF